MVRRHVKKEKKKEAAERTYAAMKVFLEEKWAKPVLYIHVIIV
jgi:hypothetical protein